MKMSSVFGPTIQGEGKSVGKKVMFVRLSMCNLHCIWCDTPYTWNWTGTAFEHPLKFNKEQEMHTMSLDAIIQKLQETDVMSIVISGGEPLLQQSELTSLVTRLKILGYWVEIETNATIVPTQQLIELVDQFNCSPKLMNSGDTIYARIKPNALRVFSSCEKANFKFVVSSNDDIYEILLLVRQFNLKEVFLMPQGITKEELEQRENVVRQLCQKHEFTFSPRIHITELGGGRLT